MLPKILQGVGVVTKYLTLHVVLHVVLYSIVLVNFNVNLFDFIMFLNYDICLLMFARMIVLAYHE